MLLKYARETDAPLKAHTAANPFFGSLNAHGSRWPLYIPLRRLRHNQQIAEVKVVRGLPAVLRSWQGSDDSGTDAPCGAALQCCERLWVRKR